MRESRVSLAQWQDWWAARLPGGSLTCLDASGGPLMVLMGLAMAWEAQRAEGDRLHLVWLTEHLAGDEFGCHGHPWALNQPPHFPGLHQQVLRQGTITLTVGIGSLRRLLDELVLQADRVLVQDLAMPVDHWLVPGGQVLRLSDGQARWCELQRNTDAVAQGWLDAGRLATGGPALVVGGGILGSTTAACLARQGFSVTLIDAQPTHAGHLAAALTPVVSSDDNSRSRLSRAGALAADRLWRSLAAPIGQPCGALQLERPPGGQRVADLRAVADSFAMPGWARWVDAHQASEIAGLSLPRGGLWLPAGWLVQVPDLVATLKGHPGVVPIRASVDTLRFQGGQWEARDSQGRCVGRAPVAVLANAGDTLGLLQRSGLWTHTTRLAGLHRLAGEVTAIPAEALAGGPRCVVGGDGYVLPAAQGWCVVGGTYQRGVTVAGCSPDGVHQNLARAQRLLGQAGLAERLQRGPWQGWAGWRAVLPGRLPAIGPLDGQPGLWVFTGGASRGLTWSALGATLITAALSGAPLPLERSLLRAVWPGF